MARLLWTVSIATAGFTLIPFILLWSVGGSFALRGFRAALTEVVSRALEERLEFRYREIDEAAQRKLQALERRLDRDEESENAAASEDFLLALAASDESQGQEPETDATLAAVAELRRRSEANQHRLVQNLAAIDADISLERYLTKLDRYLGRAEFKLWILGAWGSTRIVTPRLARDHGKHFEVPGFIYNTIGRLWPLLVLIGGVVTARFSTDWVPNGDLPVPLVVGLGIGLAGSVWNFHAELRRLEAWFDVEQPWLVPFLMAYLIVCVPLLSFLVVALASLLSEWDPQALPPRPDPGNSPELEPGSHIVAAITFLVSAVGGFALWIRLREGLPAEHLPSDVWRRRSTDVWMLSTFLVLGLCGLFVMFDALESVLLSVLLIGLFAGAALRAWSLALLEWEERLVKWAFESRGVEYVHHLSPSTVFALSLVLFSCLTVLMGWFFSFEAPGAVRTLLALVSMLVWMAWWPAYAFVSRLLARRCEEHDTWAGRVFDKVFEGDEEMLGYVGADGPSDGPSMSTED